MTIPMTTLEALELIQIMTVDEVTRAVRMWAYREPVRAQALLDTLRRAA